MPFPRNLLDWNVLVMILLCVLKLVMSEDPTDSLGDSFEECFIFVRILGVEIINSYSFCLLIWNRTPANQILPGSVGSY